MNPRLCCHLFLEFGRLNQTPDGQTCLTYPIRTGGRDHFNPATREFVFKLLSLGDARWRNIGLDASFEELAERVASDYPVNIREAVMDSISVPKDVAQSWMQSQPMFSNRPGVTEKNKLAYNLMKHERDIRAGENKKISDMEIARLVHRYHKDKWRTENAIKQAANRYKNAAFR